MGGQAGRNAENAISTHEATTKEETIVYNLKVKLNAWIKAIYPPLWQQMH